MHVTEQARASGLAWERMPEPRPRVTREIFTPSGQEHIFYLGPHTPRLTPKEIDLLHSIWLELSDSVAPEELHHHDVVHFALEELRRDLADERRLEIIGGVKRHLQQTRSRRPASA